MIQNLRPGFGGSPGGYIAVKPVRGYNGDVTVRNLLDAISNNGSFHAHSRL